LVNTESIITIHPNPIIDGTIHLKFLNQAKGHYILKLLSKPGAVILYRQISFPGGSSTVNIKVTSKVAAGTYVLIVTKPDSSTMELNLYSN